ncbi:MAG: TRAP transporter substrate-binding protein [Desulfococcaceae bacterium]|nr:TRAP transporter substrate-binding protein [Desulfococcaceae bacterium]
MLNFRNVCFTVLLTLFLCSPLRAADAVKMDLNAVYGSGSFHTQGASDFAKLAEKYSGGSVLITVHPGGALGFKGPELLKVVKDGQVPMSDILMGVVAGSEHVFGISSLPRLVMNYEDARKLYDMSRPLYDKAAAKWNQKLLYAVPWPPSGLVTQKEVKSIADIKGIKTRTYDKNGAEFLKALGGAPVSLPWGEVYSSLRTGMIDSVLTSAESANNGKFWEVLGFFKKINYAYPLNMVTVNLDYWNALSREQQDALLRAAKETEENQWNNSSARNDESLGAIAENKIQVSEESPELAAEMNKAAKQIVDEFKKDAKEDVKKILETFMK